ncbi:MAG: coniferyl aldehyde dehydrogenase, partial [Pseudomonadota bacterium]|nr:coniferyl aldehyde dehydrogenase [Pseudomonadota bacterium]
MSQSLEETSQSQMQSILDRQRAAYLAEGIVSSETRIDRLERAVRVVKKHHKAFVQAMNEDFGHRSEHQSLFTDVASSIGPLRHAQQNLKRWQ